MRDVMLWVQQIRDLTWIGLAALLIIWLPPLLTALGEFLATLTGIWASDPARREDARRVLKSLTEAHAVRTRRRRDKNS